MQAALQEGVPPGVALAEPAYGDSAQFRDRLTELGLAYAVGTVVTCSVIGTGVILSAAGEAIAFVPNAIGRALLHNERL